MDENAEQLSLLSDDQIESVVKQKRRRPDRSDQLSIHAEPGENTKYLTHSMAMWNWAKPDMTSVDEVQNRISEYFSLCAENDMKPSIEGLAIAFGTDRKSMWRYANGVIRSIPNDVCHTIKKAYGLINGLMADYLANGKINPVAAIFLMKNNMDYSDTTEVVVTANSPIGDAADQKQLAETYIESTGEILDD